MPNTLEVEIKPTFEQMSKALSNVEIEKVIRNFIESTAFGIERVAKQLTPHVTGTLKSSIQTWFPSNRMSALIGSYLYYAPFVHFGTKYMKARPFLYKAGDLVLKDRKKALEGRIDQEFAKSFQRAGIKKYEGMK